MSGAIARSPAPVSAGDLVAPEVRGVREAVDEQHRPALALVEDLELDSVALDALAHWRASVWTGRGVSDIATHL